MINSNSSAVSTDFAAAFGKKSTAATPAADRPKSQFWMNIGYTVQVDVQENGVTTGTESKFVSLPVGIPLDGMQPLPVNSKNEEFAAFQTARNDLLNQLSQVATSLKPGEERIVNLEIQVRRVSAEAAPIPSATNPFSRKLDL
jgi:hypothetical protein